MPLEFTTLNFKNTYKSEYLEEEIYNLLDLTFSMPQQYDFNIFEVTEKYIARPDLISLDAYGDTMFADVICKLNGISNPFEMNKGLKIVLPAPENIMDFSRRPVKFINDDKIDNQSVTSTTTQKNKGSKRKPNEAIVGDKRFKIDAAAGVIIY